MADQPSGQIFWIASYPCSGNTWLRLFVMHLLQEVGAIEDKNADLGDLVGLIPWDIHANLYSEATGKELADMSAAEISKARVTVHKLLIAKAQGNLFAKTHAANGAINGWPSFDASMIWGAAYLVRNPLDIVVALAERLGLSQEHVVRTMSTPGYVHVGMDRGAVEPYGSWSENFNGWVQSGLQNLLLMRFEDLIRDPAGQLENFRAHLGIPASAEQMEAVFAKMGSLDEATIARAAATGDFLETRQAGRWRTELDPRLVREVVKGHAIAMDQCRYLSDDVLAAAELDRDAALQAHADFLKQAQIVRDLNLTLN